MFKKAFQSCPFQTLYLWEPKRDSTIEKQSPIYGFYHWLKVLPLYHSWPISLNSEKGWFFIRLEGKRVWKIFDLCHNSTRQMFVYYKISSEGPPIFSMTMNKLHCKKERHERVLEYITYKMVGSLYLKECSSFNNETNLDFIWKLFYKSHTIYIDVQCTYSLHFQHIFFLLLI